MSGGADGFGGSASSNPGGGWRRPSYHHQPPPPAAHSLHHRASLKSSSSGPPPPSSFRSGNISRSNLTSSDEEEEGELVDTNPSASAPALPAGTGYRAPPAATSSQQPLLSQQHQDHSLIRGNSFGGVGAAAPPPPPPPPRSYNHGHHRKSFTSTSGGGGVGGGASVGTIGYRGVIDKTGGSSTAGINPNLGEAGGGGGGAGGYDSVPAVGNYSSAYSSLLSLKNRQQDLSSVASSSSSVGEGGRCGPGDIRPSGLGPSSGVLNGEGIGKWGNASPPSGGGGKFSIANKLLHSSSQSDDRELSERDRIIKRDPSVIRGRDKPIEWDNRDRMGLIGGLAPGGGGGVGTVPLGRPGNFRDREREWDHMDRMDARPAAVRSSSGPALYRDRSLRSEGSWDRDRDREHDNRSWERDRDREDSKGLGGGGSNIPAGLGIGLPLGRRRNSPDREREFMHDDRRDPRDRDSDRFRMMDDRERDIKRDWEFRRGSGTRLKPPPLALGSMVASASSSHPPRTGFHPTSTSERELGGRSMWDVRKDGPLHGGYGGPPSVIGSGLKPGHHGDRKSDYRGEHGMDKRPPPLGTSPNHGPPRRMSSYPSSVHSSAGLGDRDRFYRRGSEGAAPPYASAGGRDRERDPYASQISRSSSWGDVGRQSVPKDGSPRFRAAGEWSGAESKAEEHNISGRGSITSGSVVATELATPSNDNQKLYPQSSSADKKDSRSNGPSSISTLSKNVDADSLSTSLAKQERSRLLEPLSNARPAIQIGATTDGSITGFHYVPNRDDKVSSFAEKDVVFQSAGACDGSSSAKRSVPHKHAGHTSRDALTRVSASIVTSPLDEKDNHSGTLPTKPSAGADNTLQGSLRGPKALRFEQPAKLKESQEKRKDEGLPSPRLSTRSPLTCASLGNEDKAVKAERAVQKLLELFDRPIQAVEKSGSLRLPTKGEIVRGISELDSQIKERKRETDLIKVAIKEAEDEEKIASEREMALQRKEREERESEEAANRERREQEKQVQQELRLETERRVRQEEEEKQRLLKIQRSRERRDRERVEDAEFETELWMREEKAVRVKEDAKQVLVLANCLLERYLEEAAVRKRETEIAAAAESNSTDKEKLDQPTLDEGTDLTTVNYDEPKSMCNLIDEIMKENQRRAKQSHVAALSAIPYTGMKTDCNENREGSSESPEMPSNAQWANLARRVTCPADALYNEPSESPFFDYHQHRHEVIGPAIMEVMKEKTEKLRQQWGQLAAEYLHLQQTWADQKKPGVDIDAAKIGCESDQPGFRRYGSSGVATSISGRKGNPYRRPRRAVGASGSGDVVRSEYEQEQIMKELTEKEAMEKRIKFGGCMVPRQITQLERELSVSFHDMQCARLIEDPLQEETDCRAISPWTDMEKCIFLDRFFQYPKDFRKIASYLRNKSTADCVAFYYDSKKTVPYKSALREHLLRRKRRIDVSWAATLQCILSVGAKVADSTDDEKPFSFSLPENENSYYTKKFHPVRRTLFAQGEMVPRVSSSPTSSSDYPSQNHNFTFSLEEPGLNATFADPRPQSEHSNKRKALAEEIEAGERPTGTKMMKPSSFSSVHEGTTRAIPEDSSIASSNASGAVKRAPQKWSKLEKKLFVDVVEKHGKNWTLLETVIKSKNLSQIKNYYYDHKKQFGKYQRDYGFQEETHNALPAQCVTTPNQNKVSPQAAELLDDGTPALAGRPDEESHLHLEKNCEPRNFVACGVKGHEGQASAPADFRSYLDCPVGTQGQEVASHYQDYGDRMLIDRSSARHFAEHESFSFSNLPPSVLHHHLLSEIQKAFPWLAPGQVAQVVAMQQQEQRPQHHHRQRSQELSFEPTSQSNVGSTSGAWASANDDHLRYHHHDGSRNFHYSFDQQQQGRAGHEYQRPASHHAQSLSNGGFSVRSQPSNSPPPSHHQFAVMSGNNNSMSSHQHQSALFGAQHASRTTAGASALLAAAMVGRGLGDQAHQRLISHYASTQSHHNNSNGGHQSSVGEDMVVDDRNSTVIDASSDYSAAPQHHYHHHRSSSSPLETEVGGHFINSIHYYPRHHLADRSPRHSSPHVSYNSSLSEGGRHNISSGVGGGVLHLPQHQQHNQPGGGGNTNYFAPGGDHHGDEGQNQQQLSSSWPSIPRSIDRNNPHHRN